MGLLLACALLPAADKPPTPAAVAMVLRAGAGATLQRDKETVRRLLDLELLRPGDRIKRGKVPVHLVLLNDGHGESVLPGKDATLSDTGCAPAASVHKMARKVGPVALKSLKKLARSERAGGTVARDFRGGVPGLASPAPGGYVLGNKPAFRWPAVKGALHYEVRLYSGEGSNRKQQWKVTTKQTSLGWPEGQPALPADSTRFWDVAAFLGEDSEPLFAVTNSRFDTTGAARQKALDEVAALAKSHDPGDDLLAATLYEGLAAYDASFLLYQRVAKERPKEPNVLLGLYRYHQRVGDSPEAQKLAKHLADLGVKVKKEEPR
jgi:hypothetical protein